MKNATFSPFLVKSGTVDTRGMKVTVKHVPTRRELEEVADEMRGMLWQFTDWVAKHRDYADVESGDLCTRAIDCVYRVDEMRLNNDTELPPQTSAALFQFTLPATLRRMKK